MWSTRPGPNLTFLGCISCQVSVTQSNRQASAGSLAIEKLFCGGQRRVVATKKVGEVKILYRRNEYFDVDTLACFEGGHYPRPTENLGWFGLR